MKYLLFSRNLPLPMRRIAMFSVLVLPMFFSSAVSANEQGSIGAEELEVVEIIIEASRHRESMFKNIHYKAKYHDLLAPKMIQESQTDWFRRIVEVECYLSADGKIREERLEYRYDESGELAPYPRNAAKYIETWDLQKSMNMLRNEDPRACAVSIKDKTYLLSSRSAWGHLKLEGTAFSKALSEAVKNGELAGVEEVQESGVKRVVATIFKKSKKDSGRDRTYKYWLDPEKLYAPVKVEKSINDELSCITTFVPKEIEKDLWIPVETHQRYYAIGGESKGSMIEDAKIKVDEIEVGVKFPDELFEIELIDGYRISDSRHGTHIEYVLGAHNEADAILDKIAEAVIDDRYEEIDVTGLQNSLALKSDDVNGAASSPNNNEHIEDSYASGDEIANSTTISLYITTAVLLLATGGLLIAMIYKSRWNSNKTKIFVLLAALFPTVAVGLTDLHLANNCGPNCLAAYLRSCGIYATVRELGELTRKSTKGASLLGLQKAAHVKGIYALGIESSAENLKRVRYPAIASIRLGNPKRRGHYILVMSIKGDRVKVVDPPRMPYIMAYGEFKRLFTGHALLLSTEPIVLPTRNTTMMWGAAGVFLCVCVVAISSKTVFRRNRNNA